MPHGLGKKRPRLREPLPGSVLAGGPKCSAGCKTRRATAAAQSRRALVHPNTNATGPAVRTRYVEEHLRAGLLHVKRWSDHTIAGAVHGGRRCGSPRGRRRARCAARRNEQERQQGRRRAASTAGRERAHDGGSRARGAVAAERKQRHGQPVAPSFRGRCFPRASRSCAASAHADGHSRRAPGGAAAQGRSARRAPAGSRHSTGEDASRTSYNRNESDSCLAQRADARQRHQHRICHQRHPLPMSKRGPASPPLRRKQRT